MYMLYIYNAEDVSYSDTRHSVIFTHKIYASLRMCNRVITRHIVVSKRCKCMYIY